VYLHFGRYTGVDNNNNMMKVINRFNTTKEPFCLYCNVTGTDDNEGKQHHKTPTAYLVLLIL
jgi:hypothetical protein